MPRQYNRREPISVIGPSIAYIPLTKDLFALIDSDDIELIGIHTWFAEWSISTKSFYAKTNIKVATRRQVRIFMHRQVLGAKYGDGQIVDHKQCHRTLDNRKSNLRFANDIESRRHRRKFINNKSGHTGVYYVKQCKRWIAYLAENGKPIILGYYATKEEAIIVRREAVAKLMETSRHQNDCYPKLKNDIGFCPAPAKAEKSLENLE